MLPTVANLEEGLIILANRDRLALVFKTLHDDYDYLGKKKKISAHAPAYVRYLIDMCESIYLVVDSATFKFNPDNTNPFKEDTNPGMMMQSIAKSEMEESKISQEELVVKEVSLPKFYDRKLIENFQVDNDCSRMLYEPIITYENKKEKHKEGSEKNFREINLAILYKSNFDYRDFKKVSLAEVIEVM